MANSTATRNIPRASLGFFKEARDELKKVSWPSRQTTVRYTLIVIISSLVVGGIIGGLDYLFTLILEKVIAT
jgi:preprotein translocase subunit SecE